MKPDEFKSLVETPEQQRELMPEQKPQRQVVKAEDQSE